MGTGMKESCGSANKNWQYGHEAVHSKHCVSVWIVLKIFILSLQAFSKPLKRLILFFLKNNVSYLLTLIRNISVMPPQGLKPT